MKKIVIDARILSLSTGRYVQNLLDRLQEQDRHNRYLVLLRRQDYLDWKPTAPNFEKVISDYPIYSLGEQTGLAWQLYKLRPDLVHFVMPQKPILYFGRFVVTIHDLTLLDYSTQKRTNPLGHLYKNILKPAVFQLVMRMDLRFAKHIITPTKFIRHQIINRFNVETSRISSIAEAGGEINAHAIAYNALTNQPFILAVGNAYPYKNLRRLIEAFTAANLKDHQLVLVGKTDYFYEQLKKYVHDNHIQNVHFTGFIPDPQLAWLYQHANLYVFPSLSEGFGLPGLEAMSYGTPVASSNATCLPEVYGDAAAYFDPNNTEDMAKVIAETLGNKKRLNELKKKGYAQVKKYSWEKMARQTLEIYRRALEK